MSSNINHRSLVIGIDGNEANLENRVGVNQYVSELLTALEKLPEAKKHKFIIYLRNKPLPHLPKERVGWHYEVLPGHGMWILRVLTPYLWITRQRPQVFFSPSHYAPPLLPIPFVLSIMDLGYLSSMEQFKKYDYYQLKYWGAWSIRQAKKIIAISQSTKQEIEEYYPQARGKIEVTLLAYDKQKFQLPIRGHQLDNFQIEKTKEKYGIVGDYILFLSTLKPSKNVMGLIEAFSLLPIQLSLVIAGKKGWLYEDIFNKVKELNLEKRVIFTDFLPEDEKPYLMAGAKVFVTPSFWEGFGIPVLESMALGVPNVVSNVGSLPEVCGDAAILVNPHNFQDISNGLEKALKNHEELSKKGLVQVKKFSWAKTAKTTLRILQEAMEL